MADTPLFQRVQEALQALGAHYRDAMQAQYAAFGLSGQEWSLIFLARRLDGQPTTLDEIAALSPFVTCDVLAAALADLAARGLLHQHAADAYSVTEYGQKALSAAIHAAHARLDTLLPLPAEELERLAGRLHTLVTALEAAPEPAAKPHLQRSRSVDPGDGAGPATRIDQYLTDLALFRDDAHTAAWQGLGVDGPTWETLSLVWRGEAQTLEDLLRGLERRRNGSDTYRHALAALVERRWLAETGGTYQITEAGRTVRETAEQTTERLFYAPWAALAAAELSELNELLARLHDAGAAELAVSDTA